MKERDAMQASSSSSSSSSSGTSVSSASSSSSSSSKSLQLKDLFCFHHIEWYKQDRNGRKRLNWFGLLLLSIWFPFGINLMFFRWFLLSFIILIVLLTPSNFTFPPAISSFLLPFFGIRVKTRDFDPSSLRVPRTPHPSPSPSPSPSSSSSWVTPIIASNHISGIDVFPFLSLFRVRVLIDKGYFDSSLLARQFQKIVGALPLRRSQNPVERAEDKTNILKALDELDTSSSSSSSSSPLLFFPEGWDNTGRKGLLLYQRFLFSLDRPILPVSLSAHVPFELPLNLSILGTNVLKETCWLFFFPFVQFDLHFLPLQYKRRGSIQTLEGQKVKEREEEEEEEKDIEFARRVQELTALDLGIVATNYSYREALKLRKFVMSSGGSLPADETYLLPLPETTSSSTTSLFNTFVSATTSSATVEKKIQ